MKKFIAMVLTLAFAALAGSAYAADKECKWEHYGADPYAETRKEAMDSRKDALHKLGFPDPVIASLMEATKSPGERHVIVIGSHLDAMLSKGGVVHKDCIVAFKNKPKDSGIEFAAAAEKWEVSLKGTLYTLILPEVCNNWSAIIPKLKPVDITASPPPVRRQAIGSCPNGYSLILNARSLASMPTGLRDEVMRLVKEANARLSENATRLDVYENGGVSRTLHSRLLAEVELTAPVAMEARVQYLDKRTGKFERDLGKAPLVNGAGIYQFPDDPREHVVEIIWPDHVVSPTISGGKHRTRISPWEWKWCAPYTHTIIH